MITGTMKKSSDGQDVLEVDHEKTRHATVGPYGSLVTLTGMAVETEHGILRIVRVGKAFRTKSGLRIYLYVENAESADDLKATIAERQAAERDARFEEKKRSAPSLGGDAPIGW